MSKFNTRAAKPALRSPITTVAAPNGVTHGGGAGYGRDAKSQLFLLAVTNFVNELAFYETAKARDSRFADLCAQVAVTEPAWMVDFLTWLRHQANMRSASLVGAAHAVYARLHNPVPVTQATPTEQGYNRQFVRAALHRADEPGEFVAFWQATYGKELPMPVKRGLADVAKRAYREYSVLKYDTPSHAVRMADVLALSHPVVPQPWQKDLFGHIVDRRYGRDRVPASTLKMITAQRRLLELAQTDPHILLDSTRLQEAGLTWENVLSLVGDKVNKKRLWEALIPTMGYMALLRNLRNFDTAGVHDMVAASVAARLADPTEVALSRQLPYRFLTAYRNVPSLRWAYPLEQALEHSLANVPELGGRTLILADMSTSMTNPFSQTRNRDGREESPCRWDVAAMFAIAQARRCADATVVAFSGGGGYGAVAEKSLVFPLQRGESVLRSIDRWKHQGYFLGGGTSTWASVARHYAGHDRVMIYTDEQTTLDHAGMTAERALASTVPMYTWNLAGYEFGGAPSGLGHWHTIGGLTDHAFTMVDLLEKGLNAQWPWEVK